MFKSIYLSEDPSNPAPLIVKATRSYPVDEKGNGIDPITPKGYILAAEGFDEASYMEALQRLAQADTDVANMTKAGIEGPALIDASSIAVEARKRFDAVLEGAKVQ